MTTTKINSHSEQRQTQEIPLRAILHKRQHLIYDERQTYPRPYRYRLKHTLAMETRCKKQIKNLHLSQPPTSICSSNAIRSSSSKLSSRVKPISEQILSSNTSRLKVRCTIAVFWYKYVDNVSICQFCL